MQKQIKDLSSEVESLKSKAAKEALGDVTDQIKEVKVLPAEGSEERRQRLYESLMKEKKAKFREYRAACSEAREYLAIRENIASLYDAERRENAD